MKKQILILIILCIIPSVLAPNSQYNDALTRSVADNIYCNIFGDCTIENLVVTGTANFTIINVQNITVTVKFLNATVIEGLNESIRDYGDNNYLMLNTSNDPLTNDLDILGGVNATEDSFLNNLNASGNVYIPGIVRIGTPGTGLFNPGDLSVSGNIISNNSVVVQSAFGGVGLTVYSYGELQTRRVLVGASATFDNITKEFCDEVNGFTEEDIFQLIALILSTELGTQQVQFEINSLVNSSCVTVNTDTIKDDDLIDLNIQIYVVINSGQLYTLDGGSTIVNVGERSSSSFRVNTRNGTGLRGVLITDIANSLNHRAMQLEQDVNGFAGTIGQEISIFSSKNVSDSTVGQSIGFNPLNWIGGTFDYINLELLTPNNLTETTALKISSDITNIIEVGKSGFFNRAYHDNTTSTTNITSIVNDSTLTTEIFELNASAIYVGNTQNFTEINILLQRDSLTEINLNVLYCDGGGNYQFMNFTDTTDKFTKSGTISFINPNDRGSCNTKLDGSALPETSNLNYIVIQRNEISVTQTPILNNLQEVIPSLVIKIGNDEQLGTADTVIIDNFQQNKPGGGIFAVKSLDSEGEGNYNFAVKSRLNDTANFFDTSLCLFRSTNLTITQKGNLSFLFNCEQRIEDEGFTNRQDFNTGGPGNDFFSYNSIATQSIFTYDDLGNANSRFEGDVDIILRNKDTVMDITGGPIYPRYSELVEEGLSPGQLAEPVDEDFESGTLGTFQGEWIPQSNVLCPFNLGIGGSFCAGVEGVAALEQINISFSSSNLNLSNLSFIITADLDGPGIQDGLLQVFMNNNTGSGNELIYEADAIDLTDEIVILGINESMDNTSQVTLLFEYTGLSILNNIFVDNIILNGTAISSTLVNVSRTRSEIKLLGGDGTCEEFAYEDTITGRNILNITCDDINFRGNVTQTSITTLSENITGNSEAENYFARNNITAVNNITAGDSFCLEGDGCRDKWLWNETSSGDVTNADYTANVGIGTANPTTKLQVDGTINANEINSPIIYGNDTLNLYTSSDKDFGLFLTDNGIDVILLSIGATKLEVDFDLEIEKANPIFSLTPTGAGEDQYNFQADSNGLRIRNVDDTHNVLQELNGVTDIYGITSLVDLGGASLEIDSSGTQTVVDSSLDAFNHSDDNVYIKNAYIDTLLTIKEGANLQMGSTLAFPTDSEILFSDGTAMISEPGYGQLKLWGSDSSLTLGLAPSFNAAGTTYVFGQLGWTSSSGRFHFGDDNILTTGTINGLEIDSTGAETIIDTSLNVINFGNNTLKFETVDSNVDFKNITVTGLNITLPNSNLRVREISLQDDSWTIPEIYMDGTFPFGAIRNGLYVRSEDGTQDPFISLSNIFNESGVNDDEVFIYYDLVDKTLYLANNGGGDFDFNSNMTIQKTLTVNTDNLAGVAGITVEGRSGPFARGASINLFAGATTGADDGYIFNSEGYACFSDSYPASKTEKGKACIDVSTGNSFFANLTANMTALGSNTLAGLSAGDANISTLYYDTLTAKSPIFFEQSQPEPICMLADDGKYVGCRPHYKTSFYSKLLKLIKKEFNESDIKRDYEWICEPDERCYEKMGKLGILQ